MPQEKLRVSRHLNYGMWTKGAEEGERSVKWYNKTSCESITTMSSWGSYFSSLVTGNKKEIMRWLWDIRQKSRPFAPPWDLKVKKQEWNRILSKRPTSRKKKPSPKIKYWGKVEFKLVFLFTTKVYW